MISDKKIKAVLNYIKANASDGYNVLSKAEIINFLGLADSQSLSTALIYLKQNDYIVVKYEDEKDICLCLTEKATSVQPVDVQQAKLPKWQVWLFFVGVFAFSFLGAFLAVILGKLL